MAKKIIRLTESDLTNLIKRVIIESEDDIQPDDLESGINVSSNELEQHVQQGTSPSSINVPKLLNNPIGKEIITTLDGYCSRGDSKETILGYLRDKLKEFRRQKREQRRQKRAARRQKTQVQEQVTMLGVVAFLVGFIILMLLLIKIFRGGDGCGSYTKWRNRNFKGYN